MLKAALSMLAMLSPIASLQADQAHVSQYPPGGAIVREGPNTPEERACAESGGTRVAIEAIRADGATAIGRCVTIAGWFDGAQIYSSSDAFYQQSSPEHRFGVRIVDSNADKLALEVRGIVRSCEGAGSGGLPVIPACLAGQGDQYLHVMRWSTIDAEGFVRRTLADARDDLGNLRPIADPALIARFSAAADPFFDALRAPDSEPLQRLIGRPAEPSRVDASSLWVMARPWVRQSGEQSLQTMVLGWRAQADATAAESAAFAAMAEQEPEAILCRASLADASRNLWPIDTRDTGVSDRLPYLCVTISLPRGAPPVYSATAAVSGLREP